MLAQEKLATRLKEELKAAVLAKDGDKKVRIVTRIRDELSWTEELERTVGLHNDLSHLTLHFPGEAAPDEGLVALAISTIEKLTKDKIDDIIPRIQERWWQDPPLPSGGPNHITVIFEDVTSKLKNSEAHEVWPLEHVPASLDEPFDDLFMRFRARANKLHRHPYRPALSFDAVLSDSTLIRISKSDGMKVRDIIGKLLISDPPKVPYIHNDNDVLERLERNLLPIEKVMPWDRTLPSWFPPPPSKWLTPTPPAAYDPVVSSPSGSVVETYIKVSILVIPGNGHNILPSITNPSLVTSHFYLVVSVAPNGFTYLSGPDPEYDHVQPEHRFSPPLSLDQAKSLLGRPVQFSTKPFLMENNDDIPVKKKRRKDVANEREARDIAYAWGLDPEKMLLYCIIINSEGNWDFVLNLTIRMSEVKPNPAKPRAYRVATTVEEEYIEWIGLVSLAEDKRVLQQTPSRIVVEPNAIEGRDQADQCHRSLENAVKMLNTSDASQLFEIGGDGTVLVGDVQLAKGEGEDGFESVITGAKPGVWAVGVEENEESSRGTLLLYWISNKAPEAATTSPTNDDVGSSTSVENWELLTTFSVDAGIAGILSRSAFADGGSLNSDVVDTETILETLADFLLLGIDGGEDSGSFYIVVPGGVICSADDGGYDVLGKRDRSGLFTKIQIKF